MLLLRGAKPASGIDTLTTSFNTCSSCEEQKRCNGNLSAFYVSIHAPLARSKHLIMVASTTGKFQYMLLLRGAIKAVAFIPGSVRFNTCSSCEEQGLRRSHRPSLPRFNTCSSCEEQRKCPGKALYTASFNTCSSCEEQLFVPPCFYGSEFQYMLLLRGAKG